jgi:MFS family permease
MYLLVSLVAPFFPTAATKWGLTDAEVGLIISCDPIGEVLSAAVATFVMAKLGMAQAAVLGMVGNGASSIVFGLAPLWTHERALLLPLFVSMRLANGIATNITYVSVFTLLCCLQPDKIGQVTGNTAVLSSAGLILGPPFGGVMHRLGGVLVSSLGIDSGWQFATPFIGCSILIVLPALALWRSRARAAAAERSADEDEDKEEEVRITEEMKRMAWVLDRTMLGGISAVVATMVMTNAMYAILGPHLAPRCEAPALSAWDADVIRRVGGIEAMRKMRLEEHQPFGYSPLGISLVFSAGTLAFLPISVWIGDKADENIESWPWMRSVMVFGLLLNVLAYGVMAPVPGLFDDTTQRNLETGGMMVCGQMLLGVANALTLITAFPYFEAAISRCALPSGTKLSRKRRLAIAGTWYNAAYSAGCALGPLVAGFFTSYLTFQWTLMRLCLGSMVAVLAVVAEGLLDRRETGGMCLGGGRVWRVAAETADGADGLDESDGEEEVEEDEEEGEGWLSGPSLLGMFGALGLLFAAAIAVAIAQGHQVAHACGAFYSDGWCAGRCKCLENTCNGDSDAALFVEWCDGDVQLDAAGLEYDAPLNRPVDPIGLFIGADIW